MKTTTTATGTGTNVPLTGTGTSNALTHTPDTHGTDQEGVVGISGTYTGGTLVVEGKLTGGTIWYPIRLRDRKAATAYGSGATPADSTTSSYRFNCAGFVSVRAYFSAGSGLSATVEITTGSQAEFGTAGDMTYQTTSVSSFGDAVTVTSTNASALAVGANGSTNPVLKVNANTGSVATGITIVGAAAASGVAIQAITSGTNEVLLIDAAAAALVKIATVAATATGLQVGSSTSAANVQMIVQSTNTSALVVGRQGATNPAFQVDSNTATSLTGLKVKSAGTGAGLAISVVESGGTNNKLTIDAMGSGQTEIASTSTGICIVSRGAAKTLVMGLTKTDVNTQNAAPTIAQWLGGYITHNSQTGAGTLTTPTGAGIDAGYTTPTTNDSFVVYYNNRGNQTVTLTAGDGNVTLKGTVAIPTLKSAIFLFSRTGSGTWDVCSNLSA